MWSFQLGVASCKNATHKLSNMQINRRVEDAPEQKKEGAPKEVVVDMPGSEGVVGDPTRGGNVKVAHT